MRNAIPKPISAAAVAALAGQLWAGGFWLQPGNPEANPEARKANAVLVIKAAGCHDPASAQVTARAIGTLDGKRQVLPLQVVALSEPGSFALAQQWPAEGRWVIELVGRNGEQFTNTLVVAKGAGVDRYHARLDMKAFAPADIEAMLR